MRIFSAPTARKLGAALGLALLALAAGCGFQLRGNAELPYETLFVDMPESSPLGADIKRNLRAGTRTRIVAQREEAQAILLPGAESRGKIILSLSGAGRVQEFRLRYGFGFRITDRKGQDLIAPVALVIERDFTFNDSEILAKESEEVLIFRDMQSDLVQQVLRRIAAAPPIKSEP